MAEKAKGRKVNPIVAYFRETSGELRKVTWPTWPEAWQLTYLVLLVMLLMFYWLVRVLFTRWQPGIG